MEGGKLGALGVKSISGFYISGILTGRGRVEYKSGLVLEGIFVAGYLEGFVESKCCYGGDQVFIGEFCRGEAVGPCWKRLDGGGWIHGVVDRKGQFTAKNIM